MINLFKVNQLDFIDDSREKDTLRFIPDKSIGERYRNRELLNRIFSEDIAVNPEIKFPDAIQQLIDTNPQPTTNEEIAQIVMAYPYQSHSAVYDYKYLNWSKIGSGSIIWAPNPYNFWWNDEAGVQFNNIAPNINTYGIKIECSINVQIQSSDTGKPFITLFNTVDDETTYNACYTISYNSNSNTIRLQRKKAATESTETATTSNPDKTYPPPFDADLIFEILPKGSVTLDIISDNDQVHQSISGNTTFNPKNLRVFASTKYPVFYHSQLRIKKFKVTYRNSVISLWKGANFHD